MKKNFARLLLITTQADSTGHR